MRPVCFLFYSCCEEMVTHRAQFNSYAECCYERSNESRKVIIKKKLLHVLLICLGYNDKVTNASLLLTLFHSYISLYIVVFILKLQRKLSTQSSACYTADISASSGIRPSPFRA